MSFKKIRDLDSYTNAVPFNTADLLAVADANGNTTRKISAADLVNAVGSSSGSSVTFSANANGAGHITNSVGSTTDGLIVTNQQPTLQIILNASTGSTDSTTKADYKLEGLRLRCNRAFVNVQTAEDYLFNFHNSHQGIVDFRFETDIIDTTFQPKMDQRYCGKYFIGSGDVQKWTITNLGVLPFCQLRGQLYLQDIHICVNGNPNGVNNMFEVFEGGYILLNNRVAIELGSGVKFNHSIFWNFNSTCYNEANPLEIKNNLTAGNYQPLHAVGEGALAYVKNEVLFSGQFSTCIFGNGGGSFQFSHSFQYGGINAANRGPFIMEANYSLPTQYINAGVPAFNFTAGQSMVYHDYEPIDEDVMRYTTVLGTVERFDRHVLPNVHSHAGVDPYERNLILYPHGNYGSDPTHTNYRGWVYYGASATNQLPAKKSFQII
jgi:hypothetical protein